MKEVGPVEIPEHHPAPVERIQVIQDKESQANNEHNMYRELSHQDQEKYTEIPKHHLALLDYKDIQLFRTEKFIVNDEHNVYRALAHLQYQDQEKYELVKDEIEEYIKTNPVEFTKYQMTESDNEAVYPHRISVGGLEYGKMNEHGTRGVIFSAFSKLKERKFSVITNTAPKHKGESPKYEGFHFRSNYLHDGFVGLVVEDGHYEVYGPTGSKILKTLHPQANKPPNEEVYRALQYQVQKK
ncbi:hypothetical protein PGTUg99_032421 [Puccinia graminis f. sp. tritici]|uniref:Uncharacterized protein n=1 Tax=Puccinia graminis f. sp. tritici TaxID=56615 RepID=A0A5B0RXY7_PUCGR|nr:hypothetical protein PGTUg99_032421 [Puccinia graminis f. sp. tritici]